MEEEEEEVHLTASTEHMSGGEQAARAWTLLDTEIRDISLLMVQFHPRTKEPAVHSPPKATTMVEAEKTTSKVIQEGLDG